MCKAYKPRFGQGGEGVSLEEFRALYSGDPFWSYEIATPSGATRVLKLDGRIEPDHVTDRSQRQLIIAWMQRAAARLQLETRVAQAMRGLVMEVRQGYKSKDSKRQNADMANAAEAYTQGYLPVLVVLSTQIDSDVVERYKRGKWLVLRGTVDSSDTESTYSFARDIIGYDLAAFFQRNSAYLNRYVHTVLDDLLRAHDDH